MRPTSEAMQRETLFPIARVSRVPLRVGLEYGMVYAGKPQNVATVQMPVRSSMAQTLLRFRWQIARNIRLLHGYGFAPGNPVLKAESRNLRAQILANTPRPVMTNFGGTPVPGKTPVFPRTGRPGGLGSPRRFPKAISVVPNDYVPPIYGASS